MSGRRWAAVGGMLLLGAGAFALPQSGTPGAATAAAAPACDATSGVLIGAGGVRVPITGRFTITSEFGLRSFRGTEFHAGLDLATPTAVPIVAMAAGTVTFAGPAGNAGNMVVIDHGNGVTSRSMHLASIAVRQGHTLTAGAVIGLEGNTGDSTGMHLHLDIAVNGTSTDPRAWLTRAGLTLPDLGKWATAPAPSSGPVGAGHPASGAVGGCSVEAAGITAGVVPAAFAPWVAKAGTTCTQIPAAVIAAQLDAESGWDPRAVSPVGAEGAAQFMPRTWAAYGRDDDHNGRVSPFDIGDAVMAQARYDCALTRLVADLPGDRLDLTLAAYNAGPATVLAAGGIPPYAETRAYITRIRGMAVGTYAAAKGGSR